MLSLHQIVSDDFTAVNQLIIEQAHSHVDLVDDIGDYLIKAGGKRLRPLLVLLIANSLRYRGTHHQRLAATIEFIHSATLLHDDVVDLSDMRRGRLTANIKWGNAPSVLVGDFLYSRAFQMMVAIGNMDIMRILSDTTNTIAEGEVQQLMNAGNPDIDEATYLAVIYKKTAALFEAACEAATVVSNCHGEQRQAMKRYGHCLGMAFQLIDDCLDYTGCSDEMGKNIGDDFAEGKPTLPLIYAIKTGDPQQAAVISRAIRTTDSTLDKDTLNAVIAIVQQTQAIAYTQQQAKTFAERAKSHLAVLQDSVFKQALLDLADFSITRKY
ncbi:MAG: polyprenyl synthetase family protein [Cellvibrionaceae bacterium]|nr:polyprenyl synthetase family protein [Cellvibrionaceae bacterium]